MASQSFFELLTNCLPAGVTAQSILGRLDDQILKNEPVQALMQELRSCNKLDWSAYINLYEDVKVSGMDPVYHFLNYGIFENRQIPAYNSIESRQASAVGLLPKITMVLYDDNQGVFIAKSLNSILSQKSNKYEVIVIDNVSKDDSRKIIDSIVSGDTRIRKVFPENRLTLITAIQNALEYAKGEYIWLLEADFFLTPDAFEKLETFLDAASDILLFAFHDCSKDKPFLEDISRDVINAPRSGIYAGEELCSEINSGYFSQASFSNKLFNVKFLKKIFAQLPVPCTAEKENILHYIGMQATTIYIVNEKIVWHANRDKSHIPRLREIFPVFPIAASLNQNKSGPSIEQATPVDNKPMLRKYVCMLSTLSDKEFRRLLSAMLVKFNPLNVLLELLDVYFNRQDELVPHFFDIRCINRDAPKKIGFVLLENDGESLDFLLEYYVPMVNNEGIETVLFTSSHSIMKNAFQYFGEIYHMPPTGDKEQTANHLEVLYYLLLQSKVDALILTGAHSSEVFWQLVLCRFIHIGIIGIYPWNFNYELLSRGKKYHHSTLLNTFICLDKLMCADSASELYFRTQGVDALCTRSECETDLDSEVGEDTIIITGAYNRKLDRVDECLRIAARVINLYPKVKLYIIKYFSNKSDEKAFLDKIESHNVQSSISLSRNLGEALTCLKRPVVLLSCDKLPGFEMKMAIDMNIPIVSFRQHIHGDAFPANIVHCSTIETTAYAIVEILKNSRKSQLSVPCDDSETCEWNIAELLTSYASQSPLRFPRIEEYRETLRSMVLYAGKSFDKC